MRRVVAMPPAEAMRPAAPGRFKPGILERMGFEAMMSSSARMVVRSLERYPWKAVISVIGIGVAVGILMVGNFAADSIEYMADVQFRAIQREDVVAVFTTPLATDAIASLASLPGVLRVEPYRVLPARIHSGSRSRTVAIQGVDERAELRRIVDEDMIAHRPASEGLTMTTMLGTVLGVGVGDTVLVEVLEGRRRIRYVPVVALVDEVLGLQAYMCRSAVDRLAGGSAISGAYLLVDEAQRDELYHRLKRTPAIAGATIREVTIEGFYQTIGESQNIARLVVTVAAVVIAIGIVYNNARIALSERGRELASLRVLGFTRPEVTRLLLGEQAILTVLGLPLGYAFGFAFTMLISQAYEAEMYRLPIIVTGSSFAYSTIVVIVAAALSGLLVRRRLRNLDLIEVLKTRE